MKYWLGLAMLLNAIAFAASPERIEIIEMKHRAAFEMEPVIRPLLKPGDALTVAGNQLILRTDESRFNEIADLLAQLDKPRRSLLITVDRASGQDAEFRRFSGGVRVRGREADVVIGDAHAPGISVEFSEDDYLAGSSGAYQLRALEGERVLIRSGEGQPVLYEGGVAGSRIHNEQSFLVMPRVTGDVVTLTLEPYIRHRVGGGLVHEEEVSTVVSGTLGAWIPVSEIGQSRSENSSTLTSRSTDSEQTYSTLRVKVDLLEP